MNDTCKLHEGIVERINSVCHKIDEREKQVNIQLGNIEKSIALARSELDRRLESMNEFREQLNKQSSTFATKSDLSVLDDKLILRLLPLEKAISSGQGEKKWSDYIITIAVSGLVYMVLHYILKM